MSPSTCGRPRSANVRARPHRLRVHGGWLLVGVLGCGDSAVAASPVVHGAAQPGAWNHTITFENGVVLRDVHTPDRVEPGEGIDVRWTLDGPFDGLSVRVAAWPPRAGARQVALGGVGAPPVEVPLDSRVVQLKPLAASAQGSASIALPAPWHSNQVLLTVELLDGDAPLAPVEGPRGPGSIGQLALVDVVARPTSVIAARLDSAPTLDGVVDEPGWARATATAMVHSLDGEPYDERPSEVRFGWDAHALYVAAQVDDPDVWSDFVRRDDPLWNQEVFEVFVFGDAERRDYLELQVSPRGTVFDARFERYRKGEPTWNGQWQSAVSVQGTLDNRRDRDRGWSAELAIPWAEICAHTEVQCPVNAGTSLRINAFRFERPNKKSTIGLALSPPRVPDFHAPENAAVLTLEGA